MSFESIASAFADRYRLIRELGSGGMATVYLGEDLRHHRKVAVKVLRPELAVTLGVERFTREIETAAQFQHPHILPLLDSGQAGAFLYYVMPYVEGESLRDRLARHGELPIHDAVKILIEVVDALAYAHAHGVAHRDIKPENVLLSGRHALVMDFGVAKALSEAGAGSRLTTAGVALGTPAYMAPEQAAADPHVDHRADLYAVGVMGYELLTGSPPFVGKTAPELFAAHMTRRPESPETRRSACPPSLAQIVMKCLEKRPADRWQKADELLAQLEPLGTPAGGTTPTGTRPVVLAALRGPARNLVAVITLLALVAVGVVLFKRPGVQHVMLGHRRQVTLAPVLEIDPALSPDGKLVAYVAGPPEATRLYVRQIDGGTPVSVVRDTGGFQRFPYWSPDGTRLLFLSARGIEMVPALGGASGLRVPLETGVPGPFSPDGQSFLYISRDSLYLRQLEAGPARLIATGFDLHSLAWSPDGRWVAFVSGNIQYVQSRTLGNLAPGSILVVSAAGGTPVRVTDETNLNMSPAWARRAQTLLYVSNRQGGRDVYALPLTGSGRAGGEPIRVTTGLNAHGISLSASGSKLAYSAFTETSNVWSLPIPSGGPVSVAQARSVTTGAQTIENFDISPDGRWLVFDSNRNGVQQIFRAPLAGGEPEQLTNDSTDVFYPAYSPDGREIAFHGFRAGYRQAFLIPAEGGPATQVTRGAGDHRGAQWHPTGHRLLLERDITGDDPRVEIVTRDAQGRWSEPARVDDTVQVGGRSRRCFLRGIPAWSPDGRWIAASCREGPGLVLLSPDGAGARVLVERPAGSWVQPRWSLDGRTIYYLADSASVRSILVVPIGGGPSRLIARFDDPSRPWHRYGFRVIGGRFYFTLGELQSDIWVAEIEQRP